LRGDDLPPEGQPERRRRRARLDLDVRGVLAILALMGAFTLAFVQLLVLDNRTADIPAWAATTVGAIVGFYFGGRGGDPHGNGRH
jgi:hypothetical protein